mmetsp:Transcript_30870/g.77310  ORF Transcript_30870/g.77310 Transcript_30870/m.77310 type:complete len:1493 (-) Transcript_30870:292-4770(-)
MVGTCELMCPPAERDLRERKNDIELFERVDPLDRNTSHPALCVKKYTRIVDNVTPDMVRTRGALSKSASQLYSLLDTRPEVSFMTKSKFLWDRLRSVRQDLSLQAITDGFAMHLLEQMVRFAVLSEHELCEETVTASNLDGHNSHLNVEQLAKTLTSLRHMYDDHAQRGILSRDSRAEAEMFAYQLLLRIDSHGRYNVERREMLNDLRSARPNVLLSPDVQLALAAHRAYHANNVVAFFRLVQGASYLQACVLHKYFSRIRSRALETMNVSFNKQAMPMAEIARLLHTNVVEAEALAVHHGMTVTRGSDAQQTTFLVLRESGFIEPADDFQILRSGLVDCKRATRYLAEIDPHPHSPPELSATPSAAGGSSRETNHIRDTGVVIAAHDALDASKGTPDPLAHGLWNAGGVRILTPTKEAVAAVSEEAARAMGGGQGSASSLAFAGKEVLDSQHTQAETDGRQSLMVSMRARQSAAEAAAERMRVNIAAKELEMRQQKQQQQATVSKINTHTREAQGNVSVLQTKGPAATNNLEICSRGLAGSSGRSLEHVGNPLFASPFLEPIRLGRGPHASGGDSQRASRQPNTGGFAAAHSGRPTAPLTNPQVLQAAQNRAGGPAARPEPVGVVRKVQGAEDGIEATTRASSAAQEMAGSERMRRAAQATESTRAADAAAAVKKAMEAAKLVRRVEKGRMARLRFAFARWWAHSRMQAYRRHEGRINQSRARAAPRPGIVPFNTSAAAHSLANTPSVAPAMLTTALRALKRKLETAHNVPWGRALDVPKLICDAQAGDGRHLSLPLSRSCRLGHLAHWKLLVCSGADDAGRSRSPLAATVADWLRVKFSRGGGNGSRAVDAAAAVRNDADGTVLSLYASRMDDGQSGGGSVGAAGHQFQFSRQDGGMLVHPTPTPSPALWVCVRDVPVIAPAEPATLDALDRGTARSDASAIVVVMDLAREDGDSNTDCWDPANIVPAAEEERLRQFVASLPEHRCQDGEPLVGVVPVLVLAAAANSTDARRVVASLEATLSAVLDQHPGGLQRRPFRVQLLQPPRFSSPDDETQPAAACAAWDTLLEDGLRWAAALAPPTTHLRAAYLRDEVADTLTTSIDPFVSSADSAASSKALTPEACVDVFNDAVQRVRLRMISAAGDTSMRWIGDSGMIASASSAGTSVRRACKLPCEFLTAGSVASPDSASASRADVLLGILDGAKLPPFPSMDDVAVSLGAGGVGKRQAIPANGAARLGLYLSNLHPSQVPPPGAVDALFAKAGYASRLVDDDCSILREGDCGGTWLAVFREVFACRLAGIELAQKASGVGPAYVLPRLADLPARAPPVTAAAAAAASIYQPASSPPLRLSRDASKNVDGGRASLPEPSCDVSSQFASDDVLQEGRVSCMEIGGAPDDVIGKRKRSLSEGVSATLCADVMPQRLSHAIAQADCQDRWLVEAAAMDNHRSGSTTQSTEVYDSEAHEFLSLLERESDAAESMRVEMLSWKQVLG